MNHHFAELGDVWKHLPLAEILRIRPPRRYWETHAGSASYALTESPARLHGALRFLALADGDADLRHCAYLEALKETPDTYPGSPTLAMRALGDGARYIFCDTDPGSAASLRAAGAAFNARVIAADGVAAIDRAAQAEGIDPSQVLVHIDPFDPHARASAGGKTPVELAGRLASAGHRLLYWYGYEDDAQRGWACDAISAFAPRTALWCGDVRIPAPLVYPERTGTWGCGVVLANMTREEADACERLGRALERIGATDVVMDNEPSTLTFAVLR